MKLSDLLLDQAKRLVDRWAKDRQHEIWLGGPSRAKVAEEIATELRKAYDLAKERYAGDK